MKDIINWVIGVTAFLLFFVFCYAIGLLGVRIRRGVKVLAYIRKEKKKNPASDKKKQLAFLKSKALGFVLYPCIFFTVGYIILFILFPMKVFIPSLFALIPVLLGYFNTFMIPEQLEGFFDNSK